MVVELWAMELKQPIAMDVELWAMVLKQPIAMVGELGPKATIENKGNLNILHLMYSYSTQLGLWAKKG